MSLKKLAYYIIKKFQKFKQYFTTEYTRVTYGVDVGISFHNIITTVLIVFMLYLPLINLAQELDVPVSYQLTENSKEIEGYLVGGSLCTPEGIIIKDATATFSRVIEYEKINSIQNIQPIGNNKTVMIVELKDGHRFKCYADLDDTVPFIILQDEKDQKSQQDKLNSYDKDKSQIQTNGRGKKRIFTKENFKGIFKINVEAELISEITDEEVLKIVSKLSEAIKNNDLETAIDLHNKIGDYLEAWQEEITNSKSKK